MIDRISSPWGYGHFVLALIFAITSCVPSATPTAEAHLVNVHASFAAQPWLADLFTCAPGGAVVRIVDSPADADVSLRIGEPDIVAVPAFQIGTEEILVVTQRQSPVQNMTLEEVRALFSGQGDPAVQVWVYAAGEDVQGVFEQAVMGGSSVTSLARLAVSPREMSDVLNNTPHTVGILPRRWKAGDSRSVYTILDVPVLALVQEHMDGSLRALVACLQE